MRTLFASYAIGTLLLGLVACDRTDLDQSGAAHANGGSGPGMSGSSHPPFQTVCIQGVTLRCQKAAACGLAQAKADCIAQDAVRFCAGGVEQYCGVGSMFEFSKAAVCLNVIEALTCSQLDTLPAACSPEVLCSSKSAPANLRHQDLR